MNIYSTPTIVKERLGNGNKIPVILYELNPLRAPNSRINHYRNVFSEKMDKTLPYFNKPKKVNKRKTKSAGKAKSVLYNSYYANFVLRINFDRPREIKNEDGVIISRHFRSLYVNAREYPKTKIKSFSFRNQVPKGKINFNELSNKYKTYNGNFFSTEVKFNSNMNRYTKNINLKNVNKINTNFLHNNLSKTMYNSKVNNFLTYQNKDKTNNNENSKTNRNNIDKNINHKNNKNHFKIPPLLFNSL